MWYSVNEQLGLKKLSPTAYFLRSAGSTVSLLGLVTGLTTIPAVVYVSQCEILEILRYALFLALTLSGGLHALGCAMMIGWQWILWRRQVEFSFDRDEYVPCGAQPSPWKEWIISFVFSLCSNIPLIALEVYRESSLSRVLLLEGKSATRTITVNLHRGGRGWVVQDWPANQSRIYRSIRWSSSANFSFITTNFEGTPFLECQAQPDGSYLLREFGGSGERDERDERVRLTAKRGIWFPR